MRWIAGIILALTAVLPARTASAFPHINTISSETVSTTPLRVKTTFTVELVGYNPGAAYWGIHVNSGSGPVVQFFGCEAPAWWVCESYPPGSTDNVEFIPAQQTWPWPTLTFSIVTDQVNPCVTLDFYNGILSKIPQINEDYEVQGCLVVDAPTPAGASSWGLVKAIYR